MRGAKGLFLVSFAIVAGSWLIGVNYYSALPDLIPVHFDLSGQADGWAQKSFWSVFLLPLVQTLLVLFFWLLSRYPQYSNVSSTIALEALEAEYRERVYAVIRRMLALICTVLSAVLLYLHVLILRASLTAQPKLQ